METKVKIIGDLTIKGKIGILEKRIRGKTTLSPIYLVRIEGKRFQLGTDDFSYDLEAKT